MVWIEISNNQLTEYIDILEKYGNMCIKLPKDLKTWPAYNELK